MRIVFCIVLWAMSCCGSVTSMAQNDEPKWMLWTSAQQDLTGLKDFTVQLQLHDRWISGGTHHWIAPRLVGIYSLNERWSLVGGITYFGVATSVPDRTIHLQSEIRPHQGIGYHLKFGKAEFSQRLVLEERTFLNAESERTERFYIRLRYLTSLSLTLWSRQDRSLHFKWFNEVMFNAAHSRTQRAFDQNRIFAGIAYHFNHQLSMDLGYMYWIQQPVDSRSNIRFDIIRLGVVHTLSLNP